MKLRQFISVATFSVLLKFDHVSSQKIEEKELLAVLVGDYEVELDTLDERYKYIQLFYKNFTRSGFSNVTMVMHKSSTGFFHQSLFQIIFTGDRYSLKHSTRKSDSQCAHPAFVTNDDLEYYPECDIALFQKGKGSYYGSTDNCIRPIPSETGPEPVRLTLNCTHFIKRRYRREVILRKKYSYKLPSQWTLQRHPCPNVPFDPITP